MSLFWDYPLVPGSVTFGDFTAKADTLIHEALVGSEFDKIELRKWAWMYAVFPGDGLKPEARETQALRLMRFIETGAFDEPKT